MTAIAEAERLYRENLPERDFMIDLMLYLRDGCVINYPDLFAMTRPIRSDATPLEIADPRTDYPDPDAWLVWLVVATGGGPAYAGLRRGKRRTEDRGQSALGRLVRLVPYPLKWMCFYRKWDEFKVLKQYPMERFIRRCAHA